MHDPSFLFGSYSDPLIKGSTLHVPVEFWNKPAKEREVLPLAITTNDIQGAGAEKVLAYPSVILIISR
jgi:hypothetical protein